MSDHLHLPSSVGTLEMDGVAYVAPLPCGPIVVLEGSAVLVWNEARSGQRATVADRVAALTGVPPDAIRPQVDAFVADLVALGLLA